jgi:hypothetical protein
MNYTVECKLPDINSIQLIPDPIYSPLPVSVVWNEPHTPYDELIGFQKRDTVFFVKNFRSDEYIVF